ncbi:MULTISPECIES: ankyrin repeat domain-containing protein [unclassified Pseudomonas]|uniref:ankyrin repeat domain-containing protein n=1 Tax=unclassified Pseudomonas TaxID=196821 RepID=UPI00128DF0C4|nr:MULTISPECIES: ankyrin repeat domain-containing protein [unclassified Pseudomonas]MPQ69521.1 hypothetical protein [Pseudomonas sp. MWU12-2323]
MSYQQKQLLSQATRDGKIEEILPILGPDYDFADDAAGIVNMAAHYGNEALVLQALDLGASAAKGDGDSFPIISACGSGRLSLVKLLLERGAQINVMNKHGETAIKAAARNGQIKEMKFLIQAGASLDGAMNAAVDHLRIPAVKFLIEVGAPLDQLGHSGLTPLMNACSAGKKKGSEIALLLLRAGADPTYVREGDGMSATKFALWGQCTNEVFTELLLKGAPGVEDGFPIIRLV